MKRQIRLLAIVGGIAAAVLVLNFSSGLHIIPWQQIAGIGKGIVLGNDVRPSEPVGNIGIPTIAIEPADISGKLKVTVTAASDGTASTSYLLYSKQNDNTFRLRGTITPEKGSNLIIGYFDSVPGKEETFVAQAATGFTSEKFTYFSALSNEVKSKSTPAGPVNFLTTNKTVSGGKINLSWSAVPGVQKYGVYLDGYLVDTTTSASYSIPEGVLLPDATYTFNVVSGDTPEVIDAVTTCTVSSAGTKNTALLAAVGATTQSGCSAGATVTTQPAPKLNTIGTSKVLAIIVSMASSTSANKAGIPASDTIESVMNKLIFDKNSVEAFYKNNSFEKFKLSSTVVGVTIPHMNNFPISLSDIRDTLGKQLYAVKLAINLSNIKAKDYLGDKPNIIIYVWPHFFTSTSGNVLATTYSGIGDPGAAEISGRIMINGSQKANTYAHEIGHVLGLRHGHSITENGIGCFVIAARLSVFDFGDYPCDTLPYANYQSVMGNSPYYSHFSTYEKNKLGWVRSEEIKKSGKYSVIAKESSSAKALFINRTDKGGYTGKYFIDFQSGDNDFGSLAKGPSVLFSYEGAADDRIKDSTFLVSKENVTVNKVQVVGDASLVPGKTFEDPAIKLKVISIKTKDKTADVFVRFDPTYSLKAVDSAGQIKLDWSAVDLAGGYEIYRDATSTKPIYTGKDLTYTDKNVSNGATYKYYIRAYDEFPQDLPDKTYPMQFSDPVSASPTAVDIGCITHPENIKSDGQDVTYFSKGTQLPAGEYNVVYVNGGIKAKFYHLDFSGTIGIGTSEFRWYSAVQNSTGSTYAFTGVKSDSSNRMLREPSSLLLWGLWNNDVPFLSQKDLEASRAGTYVHVYQDNPGSIGIRWPAWRDDYEFGSSRPTFCLVKQRE